MRITVTARHCEIPDSLRARARAALERVAKVASRPHHAQLLFSEDAGQAVVEVLLHQPRGRVYVARATGSDHRSALDRALARLRHQLDKKPLPARRRRRILEGRSR